ncbi:MAG: hypothetical protein IJD79_01195 [Clostridia bacterium]|nr:hypothetical protein [Clostridia bacterium]
MICNLKEEKTERLFRVLDILPLNLVREIQRIGEGRLDYPSGLSEIRVRCRSRSSIVLSGENVPLFTRVTENELATVYDRLLSGSLYAHVKDLKDGFVSAFSGVRVGVCSSVSDSGDLPSQINGLVFRIPISPSEAADDLYLAWREARGGLLIYSLPGEGKTSALRALAGKVSVESGMRVAVIDERREFLPEDYTDATVDILSGYSKAKGLEIALRTLSPEVIVIDEIGNASEADALLRVGRGGVPIIATAHAGSFEEVIRKAGISKLADEGYFKVYARLYREKNRFLHEISVRSN